MYRDVVYISGAFGNKEENRKRIEQCLMDLTKSNDDILYISPVTMWSSLYEIEDYDNSLSKCLQLLSLADAMVIVEEGYEKSTGVRAEIEYCIKHRVPMYMYSNGVVKDFKKYKE